jgi:ACS family pantothenate transporter-like MFS transporter
MVANEGSSEELGRQETKPQSRAFFWWTRPGTPKEETAFVRKLDFWLLTYCCLSFFCKDLDRNNVSNAYVSGMKEDLGLNGNQLNWFTTYYQICYTVGQIPSNIIPTEITPRYFLPGAEFVWSLLVLFLYKFRDAKDIYVLRFFIGLVEATCWPGFVAQFILLRY